VRHITAETAETERIGEIAAQALADIHSALYGYPILLVMRLTPETIAEGSEPPLASMQKMVGAAVQRRTGESLRAASTSVDAQRGLVVLAFERVRTRQHEQDPGRLPAGPVRGAG
jgi:hypothetical protein